MKYLLCTILLLPTILFGQDLFLPNSLFTEKQIIFFEGVLYYQAKARNQYRRTLGLFEGTGGFNFKYHENNMNILFNVTVGFSLDSGGERKRMGNRGDLNLEFSYLLKNIWEPFVIHLNDYDILAKLYWRNYTGAGLRITVIDNSLIKATVSLAPVLHYERYNKDTLYNIPGHDKVTLAHMISGKITYAFYTRLQLVGEMLIIPNMYFSQTRVKSELSLIVSLFRKYNNNRKIGGDYEFKVGTDHYTKPPTYFKNTDVYCSSGVRLFF